MEARYWRRRIMEQCEIEERNKDQSGFFRAHGKLIKSEKDLVIRRNKYVGVICKK
jgi:hypothetical protein